jgi:hypothetical protein
MEDIIEEVLKNGSRIELTGAATGGVLGKVCSPRSQQSSVYRAVGHIAQPGAGY